MAKKNNQDRVFKRIEVVGMSPKSYEAAIESAVRRASETVHDLHWFEVKEMRGAIRNGKVAEYQVVVVLNFEVRG